MPYFDFVRMAMMPRIRPIGSDLSATMQDEPEQGVASIGGTGGGVIDLNFSVSHTINRQHAHEDKRVYDVIKVAYTRPDGSIDWSRWYEVEVLREVSFANGSGPDTV
jgi:hypothetical protein